LLNVLSSFVGIDLLDGATSEPSVLEFSGQFYKIGVEYSSEMEIMQSIRAHRSKRIFTSWRYCWVKGGKTGQEI
jgi:hypothetical protein